MFHAKHNSWFRGAEACLGNSKEAIATGTESVRGCMEGILYRKCVGFEQRSDRISVSFQKVGRLIRDSCSITRERMDQSLGSGSGEKYLYSGPEF